MDENEEDKDKKKKNKKDEEDDDDDDDDDNKGGGLMMPVIEFVKGLMPKLAKGEKWIFLFKRIVNAGN